MDVCEGETPLHQAALQGHVEARKGGWSKLINFFTPPAQTCCVYRMYSHHTCLTDSITTPV